MVDDHAVQRFERTLIEAAQVPADGIDAGDDPACETREQRIPLEWVELATRRHIETLHIEDWSENPDSLCGYGYQFWMSRHGYHGDGAFGQLCVVVPSHDLVVVVTGAMTQGEAVLDPLWECLLPGLDHAGSARDDEILADRLRRLSFAPVPGSAAPERSAKARLDASAEGSALPDGTAVIVEPVDGGWLLRFGSFLDVEAGHGEWRESSPLGRPVVAADAWQGNTFVAGRTGSLPSCSSWSAYLRKATSPSSTRSSSSGQRWARRRSSTESINGRRARVSWWITARPGPRSRRPRGRGRRSGSRRYSP
ncbi:hypothetical protein [Sorangium sp. So ce1151]|uniref:hypothetical protein n=1 Tax=Sorangium sp. So ce1151 TaxID=3133332 RepID=UPI003F635B44